MQEINSDQDHHTRKLFGISQRFVDMDSRGRIVERICVTSPSGNRVQRSHAFLHRRRMWPRRGALGILQCTAIWPNHSVDAKKRRLADAALAELNISHLADCPVREMSSGEARRVLIARALVHRPHALLFDEPCNSLDLAGQQNLRHAMSSLARSGTAIIWSRTSWPILCRRFNGWC